MVLFQGGGYLGARDTNCFQDTLLVTFSSCLFLVFLFSRGYLIVVPSVFRSGVEESVSVTIFNPVKETTVQIQLVVKGETVTRAHGAVLGRLPFTYMQRKQGEKGLVTVWNCSALSRECAGVFKRLMFK